AIRPIQGSASTSMPASFRVGMSGSSAERFPVDTARILTLPEETCGVTAMAGRQAMATSPRRTAVLAGGPAGHGRGRPGRGDMQRVGPSFGRDCLKGGGRKGAVADRAEIVLPW